MELTFLTMNFFTTFLFVSVKVFVFLFSFFVISLFILKKTKKYIGWEVNLTVQNQTVSIIFLSLFIGLLTAYGVNNVKIKIDESVSTKTRESVIQTEMKDISPKTKTFEERNQSMKEMFEKENFNERN